MYPPTPGATESLLKEPDSPNGLPFFSYTNRVLLRRHRRLFTLCVVLATITLFGFFFHSQRRVSLPRLDLDQTLPANTTDGLPHPFEQGSEVRPTEPPIAPPEIGPLDPSLYLRGPPARRFRGWSVFYSCPVI